MLVRILIADDSDEKIKALENFFKEQYGVHEFTICTSSNDVISKLLEEQYDLVMLDMTMPVKSRGRRGVNNKKRSLAGKDVLSTLKFYKVKNSKFIIFTRFSEFGRLDEVVSIGEIYEKLLKLHSNVLLGYVTYDNSSDSWKADLNKLISSALND